MSTLRLVPGLVLAGSLMLAGCSSKPAAPSMSDMMRGHATESQTRTDLKSDIAKDWDRGQKLIADGNKNVREGERRVERAERDLETGRTQLQRGQRELEEGNRLVQDSERRFREAFPELQLESGK